MQIYEKDPWRESLNVRVPPVGSEPDFAALFSYEAVMVVVDALKSGADAASIKDFIIHKEKFAGIQGTFTIDRFGDAERKAFLMTVTRDGFRSVGQQ